MGFAISVVPEAVPEPEAGSSADVLPEAVFAVTVRLNLTSRESSDLFLAGDVLLSWPPEDSLACQLAAPTDEQAGSLPLSAPLTRTSMFASEIARLPGGLQIRYRQAELANQVAEVLRRQLLRAGIREEA